MTKTVLILVLLVAVVVLLIRGASYRRTAGSASTAAATRTSARTKASILTLSGIGLTVLLVLLLFTSFTFRVGAKQYGVLTTFGHPSSHVYGSGIHPRMPWQQAVTVDGKVKTFGFSAGGEGGFDQHYSCINSVIGNGTPSCVDVTVRWQVAEDQASVLYANYGTDDPTEHFGQAVVRAQLLQVIPIVMRTYNPITQLKVIKGQATGSSAENASFAPDYDALSKQALSLLQDRVNGEANIQSVAIPSAPLDSATQQKLSQFIQEQAKTRTALQAIETNKNVAKANRQLEQSLTKSPGILVSKCLDELADAISKDYRLPAGFNCLGGGSVVIPGVNDTPTK